MTFKKHLRNSRAVSNGLKAQASVEYFILFAIITLLSLVSVNKSFLARVQNAIEGTEEEKGLFQKASDSIISTLIPSPSNPPSGYVQE